MALLRRGVPPARFPPASRWLFAAEMVSLFGSLISRTALPLVAILFLDARPMAVALLGMADIVAGLFSALLLGSLIDRWPKRRTMLVADVARAALLALIPLTAWLGGLGVGLLLAIALACGVFDMAFELACAALLPRLVAADALLAANSRIAAGQSVVEIASFGIGGWLVQWFTAPLAVLVDALSFAVSACLVGRAPVAGDAAVPAATASTTLWQDTRAGLGIVARDPVLRALAAVAFCVEGGMWMFGSMFLLFLIREWHFMPGVLGLIFAVGGISALTGAAFAERLGARWPAGPLMIAGLALSAAAMFLPALIGRAGVIAIVLLLAQQLLGDGGVVVYQLNDRVLRQTRAPQEALARVNAAIRAVGMLAMLVGQLGGGVLAERFDACAALLVGAVWMSLGVVVALASQLRRLGRASA